jgi:hypothetical protein
LRKRKGGMDRELDDEKPETSGFSSAHGLPGGRHRDSPAASSFTASQTSLASSRSSRSFDSDDSRPRPRIGNDPSTTLPETHEGAEDGSDQTPETLVNSDLPSSPTSSNPLLAAQAQSSSQAPSSPMSEPQSSASAAEEGSAPQFSSLPPAYRPASTHGSGEAEASGSSQPSSGMRNVAITSEKVAASGFYPAPATAEAEQAQSVAHRADAKRPIAPPPEDEERRARHHVATDDKRELERLRLGGSAPPVVRQDSHGAGPSAPTFEVDDSGFEMLPEGISEPIDSAISPSAPGLPAPPATARMKSFHTSESSSYQPEGESLVGSAPPTMSSELQRTLEPSAPPLDFDHDDDDTASAPPAPSAPLPSVPPLDDDDDKLAEPHDHLQIGGSSPVTTASGAPSAPPLDHFDDDDEASASEPRSEDHAHTEPPAAAAADCASSEGTDVGDMRANLGVNGHRFLPRYEP